MIFVVSLCQYAQLSCYSPAFSVCWLLPGLIVYSLICQDISEFCWSTGLLKTCLSLTIPDYRTLSGFTADTCCGWRNRSLFDRLTHYYRNSCCLHPVFSGICCGLAHWKMAGNILSSSYSRSGTPMKSLSIVFSLFCQTSDEKSHFHLISGL